MLEIKGNLWDFHPQHPICITTNGFVKKNGECVMGRGCAAEAKKKYPQLPKELGLAIQTIGNNLNYFEKYNIITFPVKHNWYEKADLKLISRSLDALQEVVSNRDWQKVYIPRPGCGNGQLDWETQVKPLCTHLDNRFIFVTF